jgi:hypothetical protein
MYKPFSCPNKKSVSLVNAEIIHRLLMLLSLNLFYLTIGAIGLANMLANLEIGCCDPSAL